MLPESVAGKLKRGARLDAPRRETTMTQNSDSGDAAGDAGPTTDMPALCAPKVKIGLIALAQALGKICLATILAGYWPRRVDPRGGRLGRRPRRLIGSSAGRR